MIDCTKGKDPENGVEKLVARTCKVLEYFGVPLHVTCFDSCPGNESGRQKDCKCKLKVHKHERAIFEEYEYQPNIRRCVGATFILGSSGEPLTKLTALVKFVPPFY